MTIQVLTPGSVPATLVTRGNQRLWRINFADYGGADSSGLRDSYPSWLLAKADALALSVGGFGPNDGGVSLPVGVEIYFAPGTWKTSNLIILPRANISTANNLVLQNVIQLRGAGIDRTMIVPDNGANWVAGTSTISWDNSTPNVRAYDQGIYDMSIKAPDVAGTYGIHYQLSTVQPSDALYQAERLQITMDHVTVIGNNRYHDNLIWFEGSVWFSKFDWVSGAFKNSALTNASTKATRLLKTEGYNRGGARGTALVSVAGAVTAINVLADEFGNTGGYGYTSAPNVAVYGTGTGASFTANVSGGSVTGFNLISGGAGYDGNTYVVVTGGKVSGSSADPAHSTDFPGMAYSSLTHLNATDYGSGFPQIVSGRFAECDIRYMFCNGGYAGSVNYEWINCCSCHIVDPGSEGGQEAAQHRFIGCASMVIECPTNGAGNNAVSIVPWSTGLVVTVGQFIRPTSAKLTANVQNNYIFQCLVGGTTGGAEPDWTTAAPPSTGLAGTVADNGVSWTNTGSPASPNCYEFRRQSHHITVRHRDVATGAATVNGRNIGARLIVVDASSYDICWDKLLLNSNAGSVYSTAAASVGEILDLGISNWFQGMDGFAGFPGTRFQFGVSPYALPVNSQGWVFPLMQGTSAGGQYVPGTTPTTAAIISAPLEWTATRWRHIVDLTGKTTAYFAAYASAVTGIVATTQLFMAVQYCVLASGQIPNSPTWLYLDGSASSGAGAVDLFTSTSPINNPLVGAAVTLAASAKGRVGLRMVLYTDGVHVPNAGFPTMFTAQVMAE